VALALSAYYKIQMAKLPCSTQKIVTVSSADKADHAEAAGKRNVIKSQTKPVPE
jgi:hypothetical protein